VKKRENIKDIGKENARAKKRGGSLKGHLAGHRGGRGEVPRRWEGADLRREILVPISEVQGGRALAGGDQEGLRGGETEVGKVHNPETEAS